MAKEMSEEEQYRRKAALLDRALAKADAMDKKDSEKRKQEKAKKKEQAEKDARDAGEPVL